MSLVNNNYKDAIKEIFECFKSTEHKIKQFEKEHGELSIPSVNELRYVGYHFAEAVQEESDMAIRLSIQKALNHCKRAKFDTYEASTMLILEKIKSFNINYSHVKETQDVLVDYVDDLTNVQRISDELQDIISTHYDTREEYYEKIGINHGELKHLSQKFEIAKPQIELLVVNNNQVKKRDTRRFVLTVIVSLLGITALLSARLGWFDDAESKHKIDCVQKSNENNHSIIRSKH